MTNVEIIQGDCREILPTLSGIDAVVTDPPYGMNWDTNCERFSGGSEASHHKNSPGHNWGSPVKGDSTPFDPSSWLAFPKVILWGANHYAARLPIGTTLVWVKRNETAYGSFLSDAELAWMKGGHGVYLFKDLSMNAITKNRVHPTQKPIRLMRWCIECLKLKPGATILDPYMGSGTTGIAALELGFNFIGIESDPVHFATAQRRLAEAANATPLFPIGAAP